MRLLLSLLPLKFITITETVNISIDTIIVSFFTLIFGEFWYIFIGYLILNLIDWITGMLKAMKHKEISSRKGIYGLMKKFGYWLVIGIAFTFSSLFVILGTEILNLNLTITYLLGWFTLASLIIDEIISILENLVELNIKVPTFLTKCIQVTGKMIDKTSDELINKGETHEDNKKQQNAKRK